MTERPKQQCYLTLSSSLQLQKRQSFQLIHLTDSVMQLQISKVPIIHFPLSSMVDSFILCNLKGEGICFYCVTSWGTFPTDTPVGALVADHNPCPCNRCVSAGEAGWVSSEMHLWAPGRVSTLRTSLLLGKGLTASLYFVQTHTSAKIALCFPNSSISKAQERQSLLPVPGPDTRLGLPYPTPLLELFARQISQQSSDSDFLHCNSGKSTKISKNPAANRETAE